MIICPLEAGNEGAGGCWLALQQEQTHTKHLLSPFSSGTRPPRPQTAGGCKNKTLHSERTQVSEAQLAPASSCLLPGTHSWKKHPKDCTSNIISSGSVSQPSCTDLSVVSTWPSPAAEKWIKCHTPQGRNLPPGLWSSVSCCSEVD